ncbi:hypothetical protein [Clostridium rectalis]|uniref:hypothetical protein n=1 Tax=Clostridium rectalis TaxID=2040295 RepID=UPI000F636D4C|nr:hypothetical protein [Clostridium rectalis]
MRKNYKMQKTISMKRFISELGEDFSKDMKERLLELEIRCVLTRKEQKHILDIKHVEHTQYDCPSTSEEPSDTGKKEYAYGRFIVMEGNLYFAESCIQNDTVMQSPVVDKIYSSLDSQCVLCEEDINCKKIDDTNIDFVIDSLLDACPNVSQRYIDIMEDVLSRAESKFQNTTKYKKVYY